jgi:dienelactone hydrolase
VTQLIQTPGVDPDRIGIIGGSFATPFVVSAAAHDPRLKALVLVHGFGDFQGVVKHRLRQEFTKSLPFWFASLLATPAAWLIDEYFDLPVSELEAEGLRAGQSVLLIEAAQDEFIPPHSRRALEEGFQKSQARVRHFLMPGGHLLPGAEAKVSEVLGRATLWLREIGFLKP